jgi:hypothetical protein
MLLAQPHSLSDWHTCAAPVTEHAQGVAPTTYSLIAVSENFFLKLASHTQSSTDVDLSVVVVDFSGHTYFCDTPSMRFPVQ